MSGKDGRFLELTAGHGAVARVEFFEKAGRIAHRIGTVDAMEFHPVMESVEGNDQDVLPPSPPLQQLALEKQGRGVNVALLVGMAGRNHWSVSVVPCAASGSFQFDIACRWRPTEATSLGSTYRMLCRSDWTLGPGVATVQARCCQCVVRHLAADQAAPAISVDGRNVSIRPQVDRKTITVRWGYEICLVR